jgi:SAM-dependent methyltransferase
MRRARHPLGAKIARFGRTPVHAVDRLLVLADVSADDVLLDIGCGDGAIVLRVAERSGCRCVGIDTDHALLDVARRRARAAGVDHQVDFRHGDARDLDLSVATVVTLYMGSAGNRMLRPHLRRGLRPGTRLVSFNFDMGDDVEVLDETAWGSNTLYLWRIPRPAAAESAA